MQLSGSTLPNIRVNDKADDLPDMNQSEAAVAIDPTNPLHVVVGFNDCRGFVVASRNGISGVAYSIDGAETWIPVVTGLPKLNTADIGTKGDPAVDVDANGNFYYSSIYRTGNLDEPPYQVSVHKGRFQGDTLSWDPPVVATQVPDLGVDKPSMGVDKRPGSQTLYIAYTNAAIQQIEVCRSDDGGASWSPPVIVGTGDTVTGAIPRVGPDGELYVAWVTWPGDPRQIHIRKSTQWPTFGPEVIAATMTPAANAPFNSRNPQFVAMDIDRTDGSNRGRIYLTFDDGRFGGPNQIGTILLIHSRDGSKGSFSAPVRLDDDGQLPAVTGTHRWFSSPAVDPRGVVHVAWYDRRLRGQDPSMTDVFSTDFSIGSGPGPNVRLTTQSFSMNVPSACIPNFGDYNGAAAGAARFHFAYGDGREGNPDLYSAGLLTNPISVEPGVVEACRPGSAAATVKALGGSDLFQNRVALSLIAVDPQPTVAHAIIASFFPNPLPPPPVAGETAAMSIFTTASIPMGSYVLTVQGTDGTVTATADLTFIVRSDVPGSPLLKTPQDQAEGVDNKPAFIWSAAAQAGKYKLEIFSDGGCQQAPIRTFDNIATTAFSVPATQSLDFFHLYSWRVTALNSCGAKVSDQCFNFRTLSCSSARETTVNGGFEEDLSNWKVEASIPPPAVTTERPHSGKKALRLGVIQGSEPLGDSAASQTLTIPSGSLNPTLSFWVWPASADTVDYDQQYVRIIPLDPPGDTVNLLTDASNARQYIRHQFSLADFTGKTIKIVFGVHEDGNNDPTGMFIDDVSVTFQGCGPPDFKLSVSSPSPGEVCAGQDIRYTVGVVSVNGPNFTSPVDLSAAGLPPGVTAAFADNPVSPGATTILVLHTPASISTDQYPFDVVGLASQPPPLEARSSGAAALIDGDSPDAPELISPSNGEVNVSRRPTLTWTVPSVGSRSPAETMLRPKPQSPAPYAWELAGITILGGGSGQAQAPLFFGSSSYHVQLSRDPGFNRLVVDGDVSTNSLTLTSDLDIGTEYFWRVSATNACGTSSFSNVGSFIVGACYEGWSIAPPVPIISGVSQSSVVAAAGKIYVIGGATGTGTDPHRINQVWAYDPAVRTWSRKADVPPPGAGSTFGSSVELEGKIYVFGGFTTQALNTVWIYDVAADTWRRGRDLPSPNFGIAVSAIGGKIYLAYGSGFGAQTWVYDPRSDTFARKTDPPATGDTLRMHGAALGSEMHVVGGSPTGITHVIYDAVADAWRVGPRIPVPVIDPAVGVLAGKFYLVGGRPDALTQVFDPSTNTWSAGPPVASAPNGINNTAGAVFQSSFHLVGGYDGTSSINAHREFKGCSSGDVSSAAFFPFLVDGDGTAAGIPNERTSLLIDNNAPLPLSVYGFLYNSAGAVDAVRTYEVAPNELRTIVDIIRDMRGAHTVQNVTASLAVFATDTFESMVSIANNQSDDPATEDGRSLSGLKEGLVPRIELGDYHTQAVLTNVAATAAQVLLLAYPSEGGDVPVALAAVNLPPHGLVSYWDIASQLGLPSGYFGQLSWSATQPISVFARTLTLDDQFSGAAPVQSAVSASNTVLIPYVEDTVAYRSQLEISNPGPITANVTVAFADVGDPSGHSSGIRSARDIAIRKNSATAIGDIIPWVLRYSGGARTGKRGFIIVTSPQAILAEARIINSVSLDPTVPEVSVASADAFTPLILRSEMFGPSASTTASRLALSNPGKTEVTVQIAPFAASGAPAQVAPTVISIAPSGQYFTEDLVQALGLPEFFIGWMTLHADAPLAVYNHRVAGETGTTVPVRSK